MIFSRLDYRNNFLIDLPQYQIKRLLKLQKTWAGFVINKYATCEDITKLKWLLVPERIIFTIAKLIYLHCNKLIFIPDVSKILFKFFSLTPTSSGWVFFPCDFDIYYWAIKYGLCFKQFASFHDHIWFPFDCEALGK